MIKKTYFFNLIKIKIFNFSKIDFFHKVKYSTYENTYKNLFKPIKTYKKPKKT